MLDFKIEYLSKPNYDLYIFIQSSPSEGDLYGLIKINTTIQPT